MSHFVAAQIWIAFCKSNNLKNFSICFFGFAIFLLAATFIFTARQKTFLTMWNRKLDNRLTGPATWHRFLSVWRSIENVKCTKDEFSSSKRSPKSRRRETNVTVCVTPDRFLLFYANVCQYWNCKLRFRTRNLVKWWQEDRQRNHFGDFSFNLRNKLIFQIG